MGQDKGGIKLKDGFLKVAAITCDIKVADAAFNTENIKAEIQKAEKQGVKLAVFPELAVTGKTCGDLFFQKRLLNASKNAILKLAEAVGDMLCVVGFPFEMDAKVYNAAAILWQKRVIAIVPKSDISDESRWFSSENGLKMAQIGEFKVPFGKNILIRDEAMRELVLAVEIGSDYAQDVPPSVYHKANGATIIAHPSSEIQQAIEKDSPKYHAKRLECAYITAFSGYGESTADYVYGGENSIYEGGDLLAKGECFENSFVCSEPDLEKISQNRIKSKASNLPQKEYVTVSVSLGVAETELTRKIPKEPFLAKSKRLDTECERILKIQSTALLKRLMHTGSKGVTLGISGGLDSTLALLVCARAFDMAKLDRKGIVAVTMPCFGTTGRTYNNAVALTKEIGATLKIVDIKKAVRQHFEDIGHSADNLDVTYENAQARERTQVLMDMANADGSLVIGTGDLSELALGWATYNGDHMSMYAVNAGIPKTLIRQLVWYEAKRFGEGELSGVLFDILDTPVSPELLPPTDGDIVQRTENIVGPYELHDFFLYYMVLYGFSPSKIYRLAKYAFSDSFDEKTILSWLKVFSRRFFSAAFKRSCMPDGPKVCAVGLSPRGDFLMPSDASSALWLFEIERL